MAIWNVLALLIRRQPMQAWPVLRHLQRRGFNLMLNQSLRQGWQQNQRPLQSWR